MKCACENVKKKNDVRNMKNTRRRGGQQEKEFCTQREREKKRKNLCMCVLLLYFMLIDSFPSVTVHILHSESTMSNFIDDELAIETAERLMMAAEADQQSETESMI